MNKNILLLLILIFNLTTLANASKLNKIVAVVNGDVITQQELSTRMATTHQTRQQALDELINNILELKLAQNNNLKISDSEIKSIIAGIAKSNNIDVATLAAELKKTQGLTMKQYQEQIHDQVLITRLEQQLFAKEITINDQEVAKAMAKPVIIAPQTAAPLYHVADIVIEVADNASQPQRHAAQQLAQQVLHKVKANGDINALLKPLATAVQYNDLGMRKLNELPDLFINPVKKMQAGQVVGPISAPNGLHILKLLATQGVEQKIKLTKDQAREMVFRDKIKARAQELITELRESAYIKIMD